MIRICFYVFLFLYKILFWRRLLFFGWDFRLLIIAFFIWEGAFIFTVKGTGVVIRGFFVSRSGEPIIIIVSINENIKKRNFLVFV